MSLWILLWRFARAYYALCMVFLTKMWVGEGGRKCERWDKVTSISCHNELLRRLWVENTSFNACRTRKNTSNKSFIVHPHYSEIKPSNPHFEHQPHHPYQKIAEATAWYLVIHITNNEIEMEQLQLPPIFMFLILSFELWIYKTAKYKRSHINFSGIQMTGRPDCGYLLILRSYDQKTIQAPTQSYQFRRWNTGYPQESLCSHSLTARRA
jgi:hypothetical protein